MSLKSFWDELAQHIRDFRVRVLTGDFNMAMWCVVVELRARGVQANLAAWYPWKKQSETCVRMDSCCILVIGPCEGARKLYDPIALNAGIAAPALPPSWANVQKIVKKRTGNGIVQTPLPSSRVRIFLPRIPVEVVPS